MIKYYPYETHVPLAQLAEHLTFNQRVRSSSLRWYTKRKPLAARRGVFFWFTPQIKLVAKRRVRVVGALASGEALQTLRTHKRNINFAVSLAARRGVFFWSEAQ